MSIELFRQEEPSYRSVTVGIEGDELSIFTHDMGRVTEEFWRGSDYEFWTSVDREHWGDLIVAMIREFLSNEPRATDRLRDICVKHEVPYDWTSWA